MESSATIQGRSVWQAYKPELVALGITLVATAIIFAVYAENRDFAQMMNRNNYTGVIITVVLSECSIYGIGLAALSTHEKLVNAPEVAEIAELRREIAELHREIAENQ